MPTPEMAGWQAKVERIRVDTEAEFGAAETAAYSRARTAAGDPPNPETADCKGCDGKGYKETEVGLDELRKLLTEESK
ncbi:MAG TPA: hypothetical protein VD761_07715 [Solirubrobacterales bacterium]|nr:hypothetical protein [Solirubrobacterales bacterium]